MGDPTRFPEGFLWGAATSAYQIEGSPLADGAGPSIWQRFVHTPGLTPNGDTGDVACDHYRRYADDVRSDGASSGSTRIASASLGPHLPAGRGRVNPRGPRLSTSGWWTQLLERGIQPMVTLYHWDLPAALDDRGGWLNPDIADWFAEYATRRCTARSATGCRCGRRSTSPGSSPTAAICTARSRPGHRNLFEAPIASHNLLRAHGAAVQAYRAEGEARDRAGGESRAEVSRLASPPRISRQRPRADAYMNRQYLDPVFLGTIRPSSREIFGEAWPAARPTMTSRSSGSRSISSASTTTPGA